MKIQKHIIVVAMAVVLQLSGSSYAVVRASKEVEQPPPLEKGWNIVSVPCDISMEAFRQKHGLQGIDAYSWNGTAYDKVEVLNRGVGYIINSNSVINPSSVCDLSNASSGFVMKLKQGWNLIGNPYRQSIAASELFGPSKDKISSMYEYKGNKYVSMSMDDKLKPWRGFWVYAEEAVSPPSPMTCSLKVNAYKSQDSSAKPETGDVIKVKLDGFLYLAAIETCSTASGIVEESDVTTRAKWVLSNSSIGSLSYEGLFKPRAEGTTKATASINGLSADISIEVYYFKTALFIQNKGEYELFPGETAQFVATLYSYKKQCNVILGEGKKVVVSGNDCDLKTEDVTNTVQWSNYYKKTGSIVNGLFTAENIGETYVSATKDSLVSNSIMMLVSEEAWLYITVTGEHPFSGSYGCVNSGCYYAFAGEETPFKAFGQKTSWVWSGTSVKDLTSMATWEVSDESIATIDSQGKMTPKKKGQIWIRAIVGDARSDKVLVQVLDEGKSEFIIIGIVSEAFKPVKPLRVGENYEFVATKFTYDPADPSICANASPGICFKTEDATSKAEWKLSDESRAIKRLSVCPSDDSNCSKAEIVEGVSPGFVDVSAELDGLVSNSVTLDVWKQSPLNVCNPSKKNIGIWTDAEYSTKAILETDCDTYKSGSKVNIRYTAKVDPDMGWLLDNCLDLVVMNDKDEIVKTFRYEGCSTESLTGRKSARAMIDVYQSLSEWDMKDDAGNSVPVGKYYAVARFYILWEPVIRLPFTIVE